MPRMRSGCSISSARQLPARRSLHGRRFRPRRAQQRQYQHYRRELRLWSVAVHALLGPGFHRRLLRPSRTLRLRPAAGGDSLGCRAARWLPVAGRRTDATLGPPCRMERQVRGSARRLQCCPGLELQSGFEDRELVAALVKALATARTTDRSHFLRLARRPRSRRRGLSGRRIPRAGSMLGGRESPPSHQYWSDPAPCSMHIEEVEKIWSAIAESDDWEPIGLKVKAIRRMGEAMGRACSSSLT